MTARPAADPAAVLAGVRAALATTVDGHFPVRVKTQTTETGWLTDECACGDFAWPCPHVLRAQVDAFSAAVQAEALAAAEPPVDRESLGRLVREVWVQWASEQDDPKPSWLVPWEGLSEPDREVDRRIGETLYSRGRAAAEAPLAGGGGLTEDERESTLTVDLIAKMWRDHAACNWVSDGVNVRWSCGIIHGLGGGSVQGDPIYMQPTTRDRHFAALLRTQIDAEVALAARGSAPSAAAVLDEREAVIVRAHAILQSYGIRGQLWHDLNAILGPAFAAVTDTGGDQ